MSRMEIQSLTSLVSSADAGGYTIPADVMDAYRTYTRVRGLPLETPDALDANTAAARIVSAVAAGDTTVDPLAVGRELRLADETRQATGLAQRILELAIELAGDRAVAVAYSSTETNISEHLAPALAALHAEAREASAALKGSPLDAATLAAAPQKTRTAFLSLAGLVERRRLLFTARRWANTIGNRVPQHDGQHLFGEFRDPFAFFPGWRPPARVPRIPAPEDPTERLLWVVSDQAAPAGPWLPTTEQQDEAWLAQFGEGKRIRERAQTDTRALAGLEV